MENKNQKNENCRWAEIIGYEGRYEISDEGEVWSNLTNKLLSPSKCNGGYLQVKLTNIDGIIKSKYISCLVANAFIHNDDPENKTQVNHKDEFDKENNRMSNLEWVTPKENANYGTRIQRCIASRGDKYVGNGNPNYKRTPEMYDDIRNKIRRIDFMKKYGVSYKVFYSIKKELLFDKL